MSSQQQMYIFLINSVFNSEYFHIGPQTISDQNHFIQF